MTLHVAEAGDPDAPPILAGARLAAALVGVARRHPRSRRRFRVIAPDLRGLGWSGQPADGDFAKERFADDMLALLDALGIERAGYLGPRLGRGGPAGRAARAGAARRG